MNAADRNRLLLEHLARHRVDVTLPAARIREAIRMLRVRAAAGSDLAEACDIALRQPVATLRRWLNRNRDDVRRAAAGVLSRACIVLPRCIADTYRPMIPEQAMALAERIERETGLAPLVLQIVAEGAS